MNGPVIVAIGAVLLAALVAALLYQERQAAAAEAAYRRTLGGSIQGTLAGVGGIIGSLAS